MGNLLSAFKALVIGNTDRRILMLGLDAAGKTTILYKLKLGENVVTIPTIGFNVESVQYKNINMTIWDVGGQEKIRPLWRHYYNGVDGLIFVVDSNDRERLEEAAAELRGLMSEDLLRNAAVLVFANKQDLPNACSASKLAEALFGGENERYSKNRSWYLQASNARTGEGIYEGLEWFSRTLAAKKN